MTPLKIPSTIVHWGMSCHGDLSDALLPPYRHEMGMSQKTSDDAWVGWTRQSALAAPDDACAGLSGDDGEKAACGIGAALKRSPPNVKPR